MTLLQYRFGLFLFLYIDECVFTRGAWVCASAGRGMGVYVFISLQLYFITTAIVYCIDIVYCMDGWMQSILSTKTVYHAIYTGKRKFQLGFN